MVDYEFGYIPYFDRESCDLDEFKVLTSQALELGQVPHAAEVAKNVPIYDMNALRSSLEDPEKRRALMAEWAWVLGRSSGVVVLKAAYADTGPVDAATAIYQQVIADERKGAAGSGDHFAAAGANDRIWNSLQKLCERDPQVFARYFANTAIAAICEAWLGPNYQMTAQVNQVRPGGAAQDAHRDYHLGFQTSDVAETYPAHMHDLSAALTLQGAVAHSDMPVVSGPTKLLPFSQLYRPGYVAWRREDFRVYFEESHIQLPLEKGDAVFFNPALFHAAGANTSEDIERMANLLQVSSAFGRAMESVDRLGMSKRLYPALQALGDTLTPAERKAAIAACGEGYSFPTNLDTDPPTGGLAPETQAALLGRAFDEGSSAEAVVTALEAQVKRREA
ncbi:phytanoyl-CoA dioxygenase family protein [Aliiroseovarius sp. KMU-50]|uniref:Phytanoyl-CoA dioxygenase family protein n=1 Tax=Aliiroseovarius salicola TaxID=3009082 RepID=A0ABT4W1C8_9RHOB|nr:phytanoyl-CoA dioxygenase family protein [Aliiroseovarius sp. KMU-50]MDA5093805.1 phytanoyl-CoA dioxygenase family protein [Aliiroseovarius sp. KMU-50]